MYLISRYYVHCMHQKKAYFLLVQTSQANISDDLFEKDGPEVLPCNLV